MGFQKSGHNVFCLYTQIAKPMFIHVSLLFPFGRFTCNPCCSHGLDKSYKTVSYFHLFLQFQPHHTIGLVPPPPLKAFMNLPVSRFFH